MFIKDSLFNTELLAMDYVSDIVEGGCKTVIWGMA